MQNFRVLSQFYSTNFSIGCCLLGFLTQLHRGLGKVVCLISMAAGGNSQQNLRKAIGAIKDSTKVGLAIVNSEYKVGLLL